MEKKKEIKVTPGIRSQLMQEFHVSEKTVWNAIKFYTGSYTAEQIRRRALELGGREWMTVDEKTAEASPKDQWEDAAFCPDCIVVKYPPCSKHIPCCRCELQQSECQSWQPCPKSGQQ